jgi:sugar phosphate isomerase/epimerase
MKIAFSTLGCPGWSWEDILVTAKDLGFQGVELRGIENELYVPKTLPFNETNIKSTIERLKKLKLEIPILTSSCYLFEKENIGGYISEGKEYIDIASQIGTPFIRVLGDSKVEPGNNIDIEFVAHNLKILAEYASDKNVEVLIETNGDLADSKKMLNLLKITGDRNVGVLWDIHHPFRFLEKLLKKPMEC